MREHEGNSNTRASEGNAYITELLNHIWSKVLTLICTRNPPPQSTPPLNSLMRVVVVVGGGLAGHIVLILHLSPVQLSLWP